MSLDIAILNEDDSVRRHVALSVEIHHRLMVVADKLQLELLLRLRDYYSDNEVFYQELVVFNEELDRAARNDPGLSETVDALKALAAFAQLNKTSLVAIAD